MTPGVEVVYEGRVWTLANALKATRYDYAVLLWSAEEGLRKAFVEGSLPVVTDAARELAEARGWSLQYAARYLGAGQYWDGLMAAWRRNKRGRRGDRSVHAAGRGKRHGRVSDRGHGDPPDPEVA